VKFTLDNDSVPTHKSEVNLNPVVWFKYKYKLVVPLALSIFVSVYLSYEYSAWFISLGLLCLVINVFYWLSVKEHFKAESTPAIVISNNPSLIAVYSNMSKYKEFYPAIKIETYDNRRNLQVGDKLATVSIYTETDEENKFWDDVHPLPVEYGTINDKVMQHSLSSYTAEQWDVLEKGLSEIGGKVQLGLYKIMKDDSDWGSS